MMDFKIDPDYVLQWINGPTIFFIFTHGLRRVEMCKFVKHEKVKTASTGDRTQVWGGRPDFGTDMYTITPKGPLIKGYNFLDLYYSVY